jgi:hypothetical protein
MLELYTVPQLLEDMQTPVFFQQDGALPHWALNVREFLSEQFPNQWIGWGGPIPWPPHSLDIMPMDFFLCGAMSRSGYMQKK